MKQIQLFTFITLISFSHLSAQSSEFFAGRQKISFNLSDYMLGGPLFSSEYALTYEQAIAQRWAFTGSLGYVGRNRGSKVKEEVYQGGKQRDYFRMNGFSAATSLRYYFGENQRHRWYVSPYVKYAWSYSRSLKPEQNEITLSKLKTTVNLGYQFMLFNFLEVEVFAGLGIKFRNYDWSDGENINENDSDVGTTRRVWAVTWTVIEEPSMALAYPVGLRLGYRF